MNCIDKVCNLLGLDLFEKFDVVNKHPHISKRALKGRNAPYYFTDEGIVNKFYVYENDLLEELIVGAFDIIKEE